MGDLARAKAPFKHNAWEGLASNIVELQGTCCATRRARTPSHRLKCRCWRLRVLKLGNQAVYRSTTDHEIGGVGAT